MRRAVRFVGILVAVAFGASAWVIYGYEGDEEWETVDAAIVLGAGVWGDQPSPVFRERINHAITLYKQGKVEMIIFTGGDDGDGRLAEAVAAQQYAIAQGVPESSILTETESQITLENLVKAKAVAAENELTSFAIVSDPLHMKRAMWMAQDLEMTAVAAPTPTTRYRSWHTQMGFLLRETFFYMTYGLARSFVIH